MRRLLRLSDAVWLDPERITEARWVQRDDGIIRLRVFWDGTPEGLTVDASCQEHVMICLGLDPPARESGD